MTSHTACPRDLADGDLISEVERAARCERHATARLIALLMEVDSRKLYAGQGYSSLFTYCVKRLQLSEHAAYLRIEAARLTRRFPIILVRLSHGALHLTGVSLLGPHLTVANHVELLDEAAHKSKRDVEQLIARLSPQPDVRAVVRKLPGAKGLPLPEREPKRLGSECRVRPPAHETPLTTDLVETPRILEPVASADLIAVARRPPEIKPLAPERYKVSFTVSRETHDKLRRVQDLMRHTIPDGDPAAIFDRALTLLLENLSQAKCGATARPRVGKTARVRSRHIPAAVKRAVWRRDDGRCAFHGQHGRCDETGFLEYHHVIPYADGGETSVSNIQLRCRTHNQYEANQWSGDLWSSQIRENVAHRDP